MRVTLFVLVVFGASILFGGCSSQKQVKAAAPQRVAKENVIREVIALKAMDGSDQTGSVTVEDLGDKKVRVFIKVDKASTSILPASLNLGECSEIREVRFPLQDVRGGNSDNTLTNTSIKEVQTLSAVVFHSAGNPQPTVCGTIE
jgi:hypothetical protein